MSTGTGLSLLLLVTCVAGANAQIRVSAPSGTLHGVVQDSATGEPVGYALVVLLESDRQAFTGESGRFTLTNVANGKARLRIRQIGYSAQTLSLTIDAGSGADGNSPALVIRLVRHVAVLPEISVNAKQCLDFREVGTSAEGGAILSEAFENAERILTLEKRYPFVLQFQRVVTRLDSEYSLSGGQVDTLEKDSREYVPYRTGKVLERVFGREHLAAFTTSDFAGDEFQRAHCFWYVGRDSVEGFSAYRIDFVPKPEVKTPDWAGSMLVDSTSMGLLRSDTHLVNLPRKGTGFQSASCTIFYQPILRSLPQEFQSRCVTTPREGKPTVRVERWSLINRRFIGKTPADTDRPD